MALFNVIQNMIDAGTGQLVTWVTGILPQVFLFLILLNALTRMIGRSRVERLAEKCGSNALLRYMVLPFLSAVVLGNPMAISMGRYLPEQYKPAYFASASYHCHTNSGIFQHINPAELFIWLGIANGVLSRGMDIFPLAVRYLCAGLLANFVSGYATELITLRIQKKQHITLETTVDLHTETDPVLPVLHTPASPVAKSEEVEREAESGFRSIRITQGDGGYGGPITITPTEERHIVLYMTGGGLRPEPLDRIVALSGMTAVNGNEETVPDEEVALAIIDCGGTLRCGIYPSKGIPTANLLATGKSGPLAKFMTEDLYVSAVTSAQIAPAASEPAASDCGEVPEAAASLSEADAHAVYSEGKAGVSAEDAAAVQGAKTDDHGDALSGENGDFVTDDKKDPVHPFLLPALSVSKIISIFHQSARDAVRTCLEMLLPFMGFAALFVGICRGSGLTQFLADILKPMGGSLPGLIGLGIVCSIPGLSAILGAGAVAAQMFSTLIGDLISSGSIAPAMALPALFAINCQCACDFIPVGLGLTEAEPETTQIGISAVTLSRFATGWIRILIALLFSIGLYT